ncbi:hypothetical protein cyc_06602 [Cyclospora cayetanensis]|uniref:Uncharacterized protein n=1 Tax=Cyclospora cayetanensis TaxID=88456 RepID=A0A1D3CW61_9EIME|nr:hypothetical protein cyc_06602 [Cyclospora cayetanensis]
MDGTLSKANVTARLLAFSKLKITGKVRHIAKAVRTLLRDSSCTDEHIIEFQASEFQALQCNGKSVLFLR